ncbi:MAG: acyltransferase [Acidobacteriota bacterium]|jgi:acetyltransferase-like isoleucine patch superfamily enzyme
MLRRFWLERWRLKYLIRYRANNVRYLRSIGVRIGEDCGIYTSIYEFGTEPWLIAIGDRVTIAGGVRFLNHDGGSRLFRLKHPDMNRFGIRFGIIHRHDDCFVGHSSILLPDIEIGPYSIVGPGSVVTRTVPGNTVVAGNPARTICSVDEYMERHKGKMLTLEATTRDELRKELTLKLWGEER